VYLLPLSGATAHRIGPHQVRASLHRKILTRLTAALGQKRRFRFVGMRSALHPISGRKSGGSRTSVRCQSPTCPVVKSTQAEQAADLS
jgi:hypothetical protein